MFADVVLRALRSRTRRLKKKQHAKPDTGNGQAVCQHTDEEHTSTTYAFAELRRKHTRHTLAENSRGETLNGRRTTF